MDKWWIDGIQNVFLGVPFFVETNDIKLVKDGALLTISIDI